MRHLLFKIYCFCIFHSKLLSNYCLIVLKLLYTVIFLIKRQGFWYHLICVSFSIDVLSSLQIQFYGSSYSLTFTKTFSNSLMYSRNVVKQKHFVVMKYCSCLLKYRYKPVTKEAFCHCNRLLRAVLDQWYVFLIMLYKFIIH